MDRIEKLKDLLKGSPEDSFIKHALALELVKRGDDAQAEPLFVEILTGDPGYVGTYYHLGKLWERAGKRIEAAEVYEKGIFEAMKASDFHAKNELEAALEDLREI